MRAILQRVTEARVRVGGVVVGEIGRGWAMLLGVGQDDDEAVAERLAEKIVLLRAFEDADGKTNLSVQDVGAEMLVVSQFTLYADTSRGRRPSFARVGKPDRAAALVDHLAGALRERGFTVATGRFGAMMQVELVNDGPFTLALAMPPEDEPWR